MLNYIAIPAQLLCNKISTLKFIPVSGAAEVCYHQWFYCFNHRFLFMYEYFSLVRVQCDDGGRETVFLLSGHDQKIHLYKEVR